MSAPLLGAALRARGHRVTTCGWCGTAIASDVDHAGHPHNAPRRYCCNEHRWAAGWARRAAANPPALTTVLRGAAARSRRAADPQTSLLDLLEAETPTDTEEARHG